MKTLWIDKCEWDVKLNEKQLEMWLQVIEALRNIPTCHLPRYVGITHEGTNSIQYSLVCFCDASAKAYATVIYLHQTLSDLCKEDIIFSKTRLAPQNILLEYMLLRF